MRIILMGFACSYKTSAGRILANKLGCRFIDIDDEITRLSGCSVSEIFATIGEKGFRQLEARVLTMCNDTDNVVIACGGGSATLGEFKRLADNSTVVWLQVSAETVFERLGAVSRPLFDGLDVSDIAELIDGRNKVYGSYENDIVISTDGLSSDEVAARIFTQVNSI